MRIATYRGVGIIEDYGYYSPSIDRTIESTSFEKIIRWIDRTCGIEPKIPIVDTYIIGEYVINEFYSRN